MSASVKEEAIILPVSIFAQVSEHVCIFRFPRQKMGDLLGDIRNVLLEIHHASCMLFPSLNFCLNPLLQGSHPLKH